MVLRSYRKKDTYNILRNGHKHIQLITLNSLSSERCLGLKYECLIYILIIYVFSWIRSEYRFQNLLRNTEVTSMSHDDPSLSVHSVPRGARPHPMYTTPIFTHIHKTQTSIQLCTTH